MRKQEIKVANSKRAYIWLDLSCSPAHSHHVPFPLLFGFLFTLKALHHRSLNQAFVCAGRCPHTHTTCLLTNHNT
jgi:hypothetical protein